MLILVKRKWRTDRATLSVFSIDGRVGEYFLEDTDRDLRDDMSEAEIRKIKVPGQTAIPSGRYRVQVNYSPRFKRQLPILIGVKGYAGIRIHPGNFHTHTEGCLLPGLAWSHDDGGQLCVRSSKAAFDPLLTKIQAALKQGEDVWIEIVADYAQP